MKTRLILFIIFWLPSVIHCQTLFVPSGLAGIGTSSPTNNVGIGTLNPNLGKLHIFQTGGTQLALESANATGSADVRLYLKTAIDYRGRGIFYTYGSSSGDWFSGVPYTGAGYSIGYHSSQPEYKANSKFFIDTEGRIGIGTTNPTSRLHVYGDIHMNMAYPYIQFNSTYWGNGSFIQTGVTEAAMANGNYMVFYNPPDKGFNFRKGSSDVLTIHPNGNIGIGRSNPNQKLTINGGIGFGAAYTVDKKLYSPIDGDLEWMTHNSASAHGFAVSHQGTKYVYLNSSGNSYLNGGNVGIGTSTPSAKLDVNGTIRANEVIVNSVGADFVFEPGYSLRALSQIEKFIVDNKHLPEMHTAKEMQENGMSISEIQTKLLQKIEELTLYIIEQNKRISALEKTVK